MNTLRLQKKGQLSDFEARRKTLAIKVDNQLIIILQKANTADNAIIDSLGLKTAADELHKINCELLSVDEQINNLRDELYS